MILFSLGFISCLIVSVIADRAYKKTLSMIGDNGGSEKINGKWYKITKESE